MVNLLNYISYRGRRKRNGSVFNVYPESNDFEFLLLVIKGARNILPKLKKLDLTNGSSLSVIVDHVVIIVPAEKVVHVNK